MPDTTNNEGYLVQLKSPEGDNIVPIVSTEGLYDENGEKVNYATELAEVKAQLQALQESFDQHIEDSANSGVISGGLYLGNCVDMGGYTWRVCHIDEAENEAYLILDTVYETTVFGSSTSYSGSTIANKCASFYNNLPIEVKNILIEKSVEGVTSKVFIPTYSQVNGGFSYFNSNARRIAYDRTGTACDWWTSSVYTTATMVWNVYTNGSPGSNGPNNESNFRPCVCVPL